MPAGVNGGRRRSWPYGYSKHVRVWTFGVAIRECCTADPGARTAWWSRIDASLDDLEASGLELNWGRIEAQLGRVVPAPPSRARPERGGRKVGAGPSPFALLGLAWPCSEADLRLAWKRTAFAHHPDRGGTHEDFVRLGQAYQACLAVVRAAEVA